MKFKIVESKSIKTARRDGRELDDIYSNLKKMVSGQCLELDLREEKRDLRYFQSALSIGLNVRAGKEGFHIFTKSDRINNKLYVFMIKNNETKKE